MLTSLVTNYARFTLNRLNWDDTTKGEMGFVDPILIDYANFVGDELHAFHLESAQLMARLQKLDDDMAKDHDAVGKLDHSLAFLSTLVTANALSIKQTDTNIKGTDSNIKGLVSALKKLRRWRARPFTLHRTTTSRSLHMG